MILQAATEWADCTLNRWLVTASVIMLLACLDSFFNLLPYLTKAIAQWRANIRLEASMQRVRARNAISLCLMLPFCLIADRFHLIDIDSSAFCPEGLEILVVIGVFAAWLLVRLAAYRLWMPKNSEAPAYKAAKSSEANYFIFIVVLELVTTGLLTLFRADDSTVRLVLLHELGILYIFAVIRKAQILSTSCKPLSTFLYLCALEIIPTGMLIYTGIRF